MLSSIADLRLHAERADLQLLETIVARAAANELALTERLARDCMAQRPVELERLVPRRPVSDRMRVG